MAVIDTTLVEWVPEQVAYGSSPLSANLLQKPFMVTEETRGRHCRLRQQLESAVKTVAEPVAEQSVMQKSKSCHVLMAEC